MSAALWVLVLFPAAVGAVLVLAGPRARGAATPVATGTCLLLLGLALAVAGTSLQAGVPFLPGAPFALGLDGLSGVLAVTVVAVTACVVAAAPAQVPVRQARLAGGLLLFLASVLLTLTARSLLPLLVGWELMGAASYALIAHDPRDARAAGSAMTALVTTRATDLGLYLAAGAALAGGGDLSLAGLAALPDGWRDLAALGVLAASLGKAAQLPVSSWLSRAMDGPSPVSALLHSAALVAMGGYLLLRTSPLLASTSWAPGLVAWTGAATAVVLGVVAFAQDDVKQLLAASTASQLGFVVLAAGIGGTGAGTVQLVAHASVKSLLFLATGLWLHLLGTRTLPGLSGAARRTPAVGALATVGLLSLAGVPPLALWAGKDAVLAAALDRSPALYAAGLGGSLLAAGYSGRALAVLLRPARDRRRVELSAWVPLVPLAAGAAVLSLLVSGAGADALADLLAVPAARPGPTELAVSGALALATLVVAWHRGDTVAARLPAARAWFRLDDLTRAVAVRPVLALSRALAVFDDRVLDRAVEGAATRTLAVAGLARRLDDRGVDRAVERVASGARRLGDLARGPQTGQVHQYYGQAAAVLTAAVVLLLIVRSAR